MTTAQILNEIKRRIERANAKIPKHYNLNTKGDWAYWQGQMEFGRAIRNKIINARVRKKTK
jgi:hypothetical protein